MIYDWMNWYWIINGFKKYNSGENVNVWKWKMCCTGKNERNSFCWACVCVFFFDFPACSKRHSHAFITSRSRSINKCVQSAKGHTRTLTIVAMMLEIANNHSIPSSIIINGEIIDLNGFSLINYDSYSFNYKCYRINYKW